MTQIEHERKIEFEGKYIGDNSPTFIIAEIGINHEGDVRACHELIHAAGEAGADAIKLQSIDPDENYGKNTVSYKIFKSAILTIEETSDMFSFARKHNVIPFTTCGDIRTVEEIEKLNPPGYKISSGLLTHIPLIEYLAKLRRPLLLSTGMAYDAEIEEALNAIYSSNYFQVGLFQCTSLYPAPKKALNLGVIKTYQQKYQIPVGFSDHTIGVEAASYAVAAGACMIEKHFTLDSKRQGFDHHISLEPKQFSNMVRQIREVESMLGEEVKTLSKEEMVMRDKMQRCIVARQPIKAGDIFNMTNVGFKRVKNRIDNALQAKYIDQILGKQASCNLSVDEPITENAVQILESNHQFEYH